MISRTAEYALRAVVWLASRPDRPQTNRQVAAGTQVPANYLSKVLQMLAEAGVVRSQRGLGGGFALTRPAGRITILEVVNAVDPLERIRVCPLGLDEHAARLCALHRKLDDALGLIEAAFSSCTLEDLLPKDGRESAPLCAVPTRPAKPTRLGASPKTRGAR